MLYRPIRRTAEGGWTLMRRREGLERRAATRATLYTVLPTAMELGHDSGSVSVTTGLVFLLVAWPLAYVLCVRGLRRQEARERAWLDHTS